MKKIYKSVFAFGLLATMISCDFLEVEPKNKLTGDNLFASDGGINAYMSGLYYDLPMEDFRYNYCGNYNENNPRMGSNNTTGSPDAIHSEYNDFAGETSRYNNWNVLYQDIRKFNELKSVIPNMHPSDPQTLVTLRGEYHFMMAYAYFALARRYGGVPLISELQEFNGDNEEVKVPRSTEVDTWKFVLAQCDSAAMYLPDNNVQERANKYTAYALKSRAALYAASVGKFWDRNSAALTGEAVERKLVGGFTQADIQDFYQQCIDAAAVVIKSNLFALSGGTSPTTVDEAVANYSKVFTDGVGNPEVIFIRRYTYPGVAHNFGKYQEPNQLSIDWGGRINPTLELVESYQTMDPETKAGTYNVKYVTRTDGNEDYEGYHNNIPYKRYDNVRDIYKNRDPRLYATVLLPDDVWGQKTIVIQGGIVRQDGSAIWLANDKYEFNGETYNGKGNSDETLVSGFVSNRNNGTRSGFLIKKYLKGDNSDQLENQVVTPFPEIRYAEVLLNYAEAVAESGLADAPGTITAKQAMNEVRHRAGFRDNQDLTPEHVRLERRSEFAIENISVWDFFRRRELHTSFDNVHQRQGMVPMADFTTGSLKYIFVRANVEPNNAAKSFLPLAYYRPIPGIEGNSLIQNPNY